MIEEEEIVQIIQQKLEGSLTSEEDKRLNTWLELPANKEAFAQYEQIWERTASLASKKEHFTPNTATSWEAIEHLIVVDRPKRSFRIGYAVAASIALVLTILGANYQFNSTGHNTSDNIQYVLGANENDTLLFSDGSKAYLFGPCSISYPESFAANERIISMNGFAYFDIEHDPTRPFEINTTNGKVEVLGTSFIVDTRQKETFTVQCITGKVRVTAGEKGKRCERILTRNKSATYTSQSEQLQLASFEIKDLSIAIPLREMTFNNKPLGEILKHIEYNYGVRIILENKNLSDMKYSTSLNDTTIDEFLKELKITSNFEVVRTQTSTYILKGGNSN